MQVLCLYGPRKSKPTVKNEPRKQQYKTVTLSDWNHLAHVIVLWQIQKCMLLYRYCFVTSYLRTISKYKPPGTYICRGDLTGGFLLLRYEFGGLIHGGAYFRNFTVFGSSSFFCIIHHRIIDNGAKLCKKLTKNSDWLIKWQRCCKCHLIVVQR